MGPHRAVADVRRAVRGFLLPEGVLVACSGGADSLALAAAVAFESRRAGWPAGLVTIDHGLQPGSADVAALVAQLGFELGLDPVEVVPVRVGTAGGLEGAARSARYEALSAVATALERDVLLGHTLDDQAETVLLGLGRGSGPRSIAGMRAHTGRYGRPLLELRRSTTEAACEALGLPVWHDPHNAHPDLQRARLRHEVLPLLEDVLQGGVAEALARTAALLQDDVEALDAMARAYGDPGGYPIAELERWPRAIRSRVLRSWVLGLGAPEVTSVHVGALEALVTAWTGQGPVDLPGGIRVRRASGRLVAERPSDRAVVPWE